MLALTPENLSNIFRETSNMKIVWYSVTSGENILERLENFVNWIKDTFFWFYFFNLSGYNWDS